jgi:Acyl-coenzyme A:6-aminopenicillanic acid acyl-transferase
MKSRPLLKVLLPLLLIAAAFRTPAQVAAPLNPQQLFTAILSNLVTLIEPPFETEPWALSTRVEVTRAKGLPAALQNAAADLAFQAPDRLRVATRVENRPLIIGRNGPDLWAFAPEKKFGLLGKPGVARFSNDPASRETTRLEPFRLPIGREQIFMLPLICVAWIEGVQAVDGVGCHVLSIMPHPQAANAIKLPNFNLRVWVRQSDHWPVRLHYRDGDVVDVEVQFKNLQVAGLQPTVNWRPPSRTGDTVETVALSHLTRSLAALWATANETIAPLPPANGEHKVLAREGKGRLERIDGTRVLFLEGTPEEMGRQHGTLLKAETRALLERVLYGVGVVSSFEKGRWFFREIEQAQARLQPHLDARHLREMDALAAAAAVSKEEVRLANVFPELFHCSGFALFGEATAGGTLYHGRILDYLRGVGLEPNATVMILKPDQGHAWVNVGYAGFIGSVSAMNDKQIAIGEMGGRGEGDWDGKPMAQLVRELMEKAGTLEEAIEILRRGPRTCEYYYVISDGKTKQAVGIAATPKKFEIIRAGESHPQLPHAIKDAVLMSADERYTKLVERVRAGHGKFNPDTARDVMRSPVCMDSNIQSVLFAPETLDFWVSNADSKSVASHARYTRYNLRELLKPAPTVSSVR